MFRNKWQIKKKNSKLNQEKNTRMKDKKIHENKKNKDNEKNNNKEKEITKKMEMENKPQQKSTK